jgi:DNA-binding NarL/FixJ family response regulator
VKLRVLLADDHVLVRQGIASMLRENPDVEIVAEVDGGRAAVTAARQSKPDLVIMDVVMQDMGGVEATRQIVGDNAATKVIALSMYDTQSHISAMLEAGAVGYVLKMSAFDELDRAISVINGGDFYLCSTITGVVVKDYLQRMRTGNRLPATAPRLSSREREVLQQIAEGRSSKEIARILGVSPKTVDSHRMHIMAKLKIANVAGLTKFALREGLTSIDS